MAHPLKKTIRAVQSKLHEDPKLDYVHYTWVLQQVEREYASAKAEVPPGPGFKDRLETILVERIRPLARLDSDAVKSHPVG